MAAAVFEAIEGGDPAWRSLDIRVEPGITAMLAAAARVGAPLGGDFCAMSLSDNLKPWEVDRGAAARGARGGFRGRALQPDLVGAALAARRGLQARRTRRAAPIRRSSSHAPSGGRTSASGSSQLVEVEASMADMSTLVIIGASTTRLIERPAAKRLTSIRRASIGAADDALEPHERRVDAPHRRRRRGLLRPRHHDDRKPERARRRDLRIGRRAAGILRHDNLDALRAPSALAPPPRRRARGPGSPIDVRHRQALADRLDGAHEIDGAAARPRRRRVSRRPTVRKTRRGFAPSAPTASSIARPRSSGRPPVAPWRTAQGEQRTRQLRAGLRGVARDHRRERMGRVDHRLDPLLDAANARGPPRRRSRRRASGSARASGSLARPAGERQAERRIGRTRQPPASAEASVGAAENENAHARLVP